jgi:hypothetical protein
MEDGAGPGVTPEYMGVWKGGSLSWDFGTEEKIEIPDDSAYGAFQEVASLPGTEGKPSMTLTARYSQNLSDMLRLARRRCYHDFQVHVGSCEDLQDFDGGWQKIVVLEHGAITNYGTEDLGALGSGDRAAVNESIDIQMRDYYEIKRIDSAEICTTSVVQEVVAVAFCDRRACGECGEVSDGCQRLFALILASSGSPGLGAQVVYSADGGSTCGSTVISTLAANEDPDDMSCFGDYIVVVSETSGTHHYADRTDILNGVAAWAESAAYETGGEPRCIWVLRPGYAWVGGAGGYIYFLDSAESDPVVQDAGSATSEDLNDVHAFDEENIIAVGDNNALIKTTNGGTWGAVTGPAVGVDLLSCWMRSKTEWWIGTANGKLFYTTNSGISWTEKTFPGSGTGSVRDIVFVSTQVGYIAHTTAAPLGRILRTISGGNRWYVLPEGTGSIPANDRINALATCGDPNLIVGGGLADSATDGFLVKFN